MSPIIWSRWKLGLLCLAVTGLMLAPWVRNHRFLRDFYDYGLFINVNARFDEGQRLFVDFTTPAQSATFALNHLAERWGGGSYVGMTWGAAGLIGLVAVTLTLLLARRWPPVLSCVFVAAIVACSASQHTIIFYNPVGVFAMALVVWSFAVAPLLRREHAGWHALAAAGLVLGGLNKINFHLLSCAMAIGWIAWGAVEQRAPWRRVAASLGFVCGFGLVLPLAIELAWTGADLRTWYYNVVQLPLGARGGRVGLLTDAKVYFATLHDYYGPLRLPQSGLVVLLLPLLAVPAAGLCGGERPWLRWAFALLAGLCGALSGAALLLTNNEIVYLAVAASLVMLAGLWLGFRLPVRGRGPWLALGAPAVFVGVCGWESAWQGQRSQFGHAGEARSSYVQGETIGSEFGYLRGLAIPMSIAGSLGDFAAYRKTLGAEANQVFYGPGIEWLERVWPAPKVKGLPLVAAAFESAKELTLLQREVLAGDRYRHVLVVEAWNSWPLSVQETLMRRFTMERMGRFFVYHKLRAGVLWARPLAFHENIGGNVDSLRLVSNLPMQLLPDGRRFVGTDRGVGELEIDAPSYRASGVAIVRRIEKGRALAPIKFEAHAVQGASRYLRWSRDINLPDDADELVVPTGQLDASGLNLVFTVTVPQSDAGAVVAGWREPQLWNTVESDAPPPLLQEASTAGGGVPVALQTALLPPALRGATVFGRETDLRDGACWLVPGGEVWIKLPGIVSKIEIEAQAAGSPAGTTPQLRVIYYKGGRLEFFHPIFDKETNLARYTAWSAESGGWLAVLADPHRACPPFSVKIVRIERH
ncbi:hypothetical protein [Oleiharenicola sp. Vm1]|uniref:hypothetical protein n=1 Tax=Oleiharenicola sp. Vm1 TaxID=3398393 RepID=UPI0039F5AADF